MAALCVGIDQCLNTPIFYFSSVSYLPQVCIRVIKVLYEALRIINCLKLLLQ